MARFLGDEECPPRSGMQSVMGSAVWGGGFFEQQVIFLKTNVCLAFPQVRLPEPT